MRAYKRAIERRTNTPQTEMIPGREKDQKVNHAGGVGFRLSPMAQVLRFLILGTEGGTYYSRESEHTAENTKVLQGVLNQDPGVKAVELIREVSVSGRAPKVSPTLYALALAYASTSRAVRKAAAGALPAVVRTNAHMLEFVDYVNGLRGWGRLLRESVANWYNDQPADKLGYQLAKYRQRGDWTTQDVLRMAKPQPASEEHSAVFRWACSKLYDGVPLDDVEYQEVRFGAGKYIAGLEEATGIPELTTRGQKSRAVRLINDYDLTREMIPTTWLNAPEVWEALLNKMPMTAMIRNLNKMTAVGLIGPLSEAGETVCRRLKDKNYLTRSRIHPYNVLMALSTYRAGRGVKGRLRWTPDQRILGALGSAFHNTFDNITPTGKRYMLALDVSGSMGYYSLANSHLTAREASAAMAMATARVEENSYFTGFQRELVPLDIDASMSLNTVISSISDLPFGITDCGAPMRYAIQHKIPVDVFVIYTDNETWAGPMHPSQALDRYRKIMGIDAKLAVVGMTATNISIADPKDPGMLDFVGFDASAPKLISEFAVGFNTEKVHD